MISNGNREPPLTKELLEQLRTKNASLQAENDDLREENTALQNTVARQAILLSVQGDLVHLTQPSSILNQKVPVDKEIAINKDQSHTDDCVLL